MCSVSVSGFSRYFSKNKKNPNLSQFRVLSLKSREKPEKKNKRAQLFRIRGYKMLQSRVTYVYNYDRLDLKKLILLDSNLFYGRSLFS
jgi:hypothetical protein